MLLAIDPGTTKSGWVVMDGYKPMGHGIHDNETIIEAIHSGRWNITQAVIEKISYQGMNVGQSTFDTCEWVGRFHEALAMKGIRPFYVKRRDVQINLCGTVKAGDANVKGALVARFAPDDGPHGKGTKSKPGWFHGFASHKWQAYAAGVTGLDMMRRGDQL